MLPLKVKVIYKCHPPLSLWESRCWDLLGRGVEVSEWFMIKTPPGEACLSTAGAAVWCDNLLSSCQDINFIKGKTARPVIQWASADGHH